MLLMGERLASLRHNFFVVLGIWRYTKPNEIAENKKGSCYLPGKVGGY